MKISSGFHRAELKRKYTTPYYSIRHTLIIGTCFDSFLTIFFWRCFFPSNNTYSLFMHAFVVNIIIQNNSRSYQYTNTNILLRNQFLVKYYKWTNLFWAFFFWEEVYFSLHSRQRMLSLQYSTTIIQLDASDFCVCVCGLSSYAYTYTHTHKQIVNLRWYFVREATRLYNHFQKFGFCCRRRWKFWYQVCTVDSGTNVSLGFGCIWAWLTAKLLI